jgi:acyl carrier protein
MQIRGIVISQILRTAEQQRKVLAPLTDDLPLLESGLDSLCIAIIVASLDDSLGIDPFDGGTTIPQTLGDLVQLYEDASLRSSVVG